MTVPQTPKPVDKCKYCPIRTGCDIFSEMCRLTAAGVPRLRPDLIKTLTRQQRFYRAHKAEIREKYVETFKTAMTKYMSVPANREKVAARNKDWWARNRGKRAKVLD